MGASFAEAAIIDFSPMSASYNVGQTFPVRVRVSSTGEAMNAASGVIIFPEELLEVVSVSKTDSIISLWVQEPSFSNGNGTVNFEGIVLNPGFVGTAGRVITVQFRAKSVGRAVLSFSSAAALANDGKGTNILTNTGTAAITIGVVSEEAATPPSGGELVITSSTHPDQSKWYPAKDVELSWKLPESADALRLLLDKFSRSTPTVSYAEPFDSKRIENVDNGLWYFHLRFREGGTWGSVAHYRLQIDAEKPRFFDIKESPRSDQTDPRVTFVVAAADDVSGTDHYEFKLNSNDAPVETWKDDGSSRYTMKPLPPGKYLLYAKVFDRAGNWLANSVEFEIAGLEAPVITDAPSQVEEKESFSVSGRSKYVSSPVRLVFKDGAETHAVEGRTNARGEFTVHVEGNTIPRGSYKVTAIIVDSRGAESYPSEPVKIGIVQNILFRFGSFAVTFLTLLVPLVALLFALAFLIWYGWHRFTQFRRRLQKEVREAEGSLHKTFDMLREDIREQVKVLERVRTKRQLTAEEERIIKTFKKHLDDAEKYVNKEIKDIEEIKFELK
ncbi:MAG: hypothetical protein Q8Q36_00355 [bacterium]|nr:hypothetical protein [bacterium]